jgi:hypothetical protein
LRIAANPAPSRNAHAPPKDETARFDSGHLSYRPVPERLDQGVDHGGEQVGVVEESPVVGVPVHKAESLSDPHL